MQVGIFILTLSSESGKQDCLQRLSVGCWLMEYLYISQHVRVISSCGWGVLVAIGASTQVCPVC